MPAHLIQHLYTLGLDALRLAIWLFILGAIFVPLERLFTLHKPAGKRPERGIDQAYYFLNNLLPALIIAVPATLLAALANKLLPGAYIEALASLPLWVLLVLGTLAAEVGSYWGHRWCHQNAWLWRFHAVHHSPTQMDWLVNSRAHPLDMVFTRFCGLVPVYALGLAQARGLAGTAAVPLAVTFVTTLWSFFIHANLRWRFGPLEWLLATPAFHHWHHTNDEHRDHNYAALFPLVDRLFGTLHLPSHWPPCYGIDAAMPASLQAQLLDPFMPVRKQAGAAGSI